MNAITFITPAKAKKMAARLEAFDYKLELETGAIDCPTVDASSLHTKLERVAKEGKGEYLSNILDSFCAVNGLPVSLVASSLR